LFEYARWCAAIAQKRDRGIVVPCASVQQNDCVVLAHARSFA